MNDKKTYLKATLEILSATSLEIVTTLSLGVIERVSYAEKLRALLQENNPEYLILCSISEHINPDYSPLTTALNEANKNSNSKID